MAFAVFCLSSGPAACAVFLLELGFRGFLLGFRSILLARWCQGIIHSVELARLRKIPRWVCAIFVLELFFRGSLLGFSTVLFERHRGKTIWSTRAIGVDCCFVSRRTQLLIGQFFVEASCAFGVSCWAFALCWPSTGRENVALS